jgi:3-oxoacyl-[acyl-carrier protein] reductase
MSRYNQGIERKTFKLYAKEVEVVLRQRNHTEGGIMASNLIFNLAGKTAVVTGGAQGIGFEIVKSFLASGASVTIWDYSEEALKKTVAELSQYSDQLSVSALDITNRQSIAEAVKKLSQPVDILVNNAGITRDKSFAKMGDGDWDAVIATNLTGLFNVTKALFEKFNTQSQHKRIINISSVVGLYGNFGQTNYAATKAGVIGMTKTWAKELGRKGWTSNAIAPGFISTPMTAAMPPEVLQQMASKVPAARLGEVSDIANAVLFLASEQASYINGAVLSVDGGLTL